jgi:hypothetical protein
MKEKLQEYALFAEIVSSLAVLLTLIFLVIELRENTEVTRSTAFGNITEQLNNFRLTVNSEELLSDVWRSYLSEDFENQTESERVRMGGIVIALLSIYEDAYYSYDYGIMGEREWSRFEPRICQHYGRLQRRNQLPILNGLTPAFQEYTEQLCTR